MWLHFLSTILVFSVWGDPVVEAKRAPLSTYLKNWAEEIGDKEVRRILSMDGPERRKLIDGLNEKLKAGGYPTIEGYTGIVMRKSCIVGFIDTPECFEGLDITDAKNRFCLPCIIPHNEVHWLIQEKSKPLPKINGRPLDNQSPKPDEPAAKK